MTSFEYGFSATQGQRGYQEDAAVLWPAQIATADDGPEATFEWDLSDLPSAETDGLVAVLADGMGGHAGGALASKTVCEAFIDSWVGRLAKGGGDVDGPPVTHEKLQSALEAGNDRITDIVRSDPALSGMGSTLVGTIFGPQGLEWISVGDSPLYLYRREEIALLNEDHSLAPALDKLALEGKISAEQAKNDPRRHMLRSAITGEELDLIDLSRKPLHLEAGDYVIVASDGIHTLDERELVRVVNGYADDGPRAVSQAIIRAIENARDPYQDNATVIAVRQLA